MYKVGLFSGVFDPLHVGHLDCIYSAAAKCDKVYIAISSSSQCGISPLVKYRWVYSLTEHLKNVRIITTGREGDRECSWANDAKEIKAQIGVEVDAVFCGEGHPSLPVWKSAFPAAKIENIPHNSCDSSRIRQNPMKYWDWMPSVVRSYFVKHVLVVGPPSSGKSTLVKHLANYFNTNYVPEAGREISQRSGSTTKMLPGDYTSILLEQKMTQMDAVKFSNRVLFVDTDALTSLVFLKYLNKFDSPANEHLAASIAELNEWDLVLYLMNDVPFVQDGVRCLLDGEAEFAQHLFDTFSRLPNVNVISGNYLDRYEKAKALVRTMLNYY